MKPFVPCVLSTHVNQSGVVQLYVDKIVTLWSACWYMVIGHWSMVIGQWSMVIDHWSMVNGPLMQWTRLRSESGQKRTLAISANQACVLLKHAQRIEIR